jgi:hypothetical protein
MNTVALSIKKRKEKMRKIQEDSGEMAISIVTAEIKT